MDLECVEDDVHLCLRCRETIVGLDNYVNHRKSRSCTPVNYGKGESNVKLIENFVSSKNISNDSKAKEIDQNDKTNKTYQFSNQNDSSVRKEHTNIIRIDDSISYNNLENKINALQNPNLEIKSDLSLKADDFFSLLELQSSSKIASSGFTGLPTSPGLMNLSNKIDRTKSSYSIVTRSKSLAKAKETIKSSQIVKETQNVCGITGNTNKDNLDSNNYIIEPCSPVILPGSNDVNNTGLQDSSSNVSGLTKKSYESSSDSLNYITLPMVADRPDFNNTASCLNTQEDIDEDLDDAEEEDEDDDDEGVNPPRTHTGGKWKPGSNWRTEDMWSNQPPPSHTGGKWKPSIPALSDNKQSQIQFTTPNQPKADQHLEEQRQQGVRYFNHPPPGHTRGKWMPIGDTGGPNLRKAGNQVQYWCGVCNRRLSSRGIYERHLKSHLHAKRTRQERQLDEDLMSPNPVRPIRFTRGVKLSSRPTNKITAAKNKVKRARRTVICEICGARVLRYHMGKHIVSQFHRRRALNHPSAGPLILANVVALAYQAPLQCSLCRFYCNSSHYLLLHWDSKMHTDNDLKIEGRYLCSLCRYNCVSSSGMKYHLLSVPHQELVSAINRSVPVVIQKVTMLQCLQPGCDKMYRLNVQLRQHSRLTGHDLAGCTACDSYQERIACPRCPHTAHSRRRLNQHLTTRHRINGSKYSCSDCALRFKNKEEAKLHRSSKEHKYESLRRKNTSKQLQRKCFYCSEICPDVPRLKKHLKEKHPNKNHRCARCGVTFTLKQELARHARSQCKGIAVVDSNQTEDDNEVDVNWPEKTSTTLWESSESISLNDGNEHTSPSALPMGNQCPKCPFRSTSSSEILFHIALHNDPVLILEKGAKPQNLVPKYICPSCPRAFIKDILKKHIKTHTDERVHVCSECGASFARTDVLSKHLKNVHKIFPQCKICATTCSASSSLQRHLTCHHERSKNYLCAECGSAFYDKNSLQQHVQIHSGKKVECTEPGCVFKGRSVTELNYHLRTHSDQRPFSCDNCSYTAKTKAQLARHSKKHLGMAGKSHECKHCDLKFSSSSHLRRHLRLHTGSKPYHCPHCSYTCNLLENLRKHVLSTKKHPGKFLYSCIEENCQFSSNSAKDFRAHLILEHNKNTAAAASYVTGLYQSSEDQTNEIILSSFRANKDSKIQLIKETINDPSSTTYLSNPTLASVANRQDDPMSIVTVTEPSDEIIYIQLASDDSLDTYDGVPFFSSADHFLSSERPLFFENLSNRTTTSHVNLGDSALLVPPTESERELIVIGESTIELLPHEVKKK